MHVLGDRIAVTIATCGGVGRCSKHMPGTIGSLLAYPLLYGCWRVLDPTIMWNYPLIAIQQCVMWVCLVALVLLPLGIYAAGRYTRITGTEDAKEIVIDEVVGQMLTIALCLPALWLLSYQTADPDLPAAAIFPGWVIAVVASSSFAFFRLCDIQKPWPVRWIDQNIHNGWGIMADDLCAAILAAMFFYALLFGCLEMFH